VTGPAIALEGLVITRYAHGAPDAAHSCGGSGHPVPDDAGEVAAREIHGACFRTAAVIFYWH
jgi:hydroxypyruvate reductase